LQCFDGSLFCSVVCHFHKGKASFASGVPFQRKGTIAYLAIGGEEFDDVFLFRAEGKVADKNAHWP
jgi:hypothetical protein